MKDRKGDTLLHWAAENNEIDKARLLVVDYIHSTEIKDKKVTINEDYVNEKLKDISMDEDLSRFIL